jgi:hypothetical protein
MSRSVGWPRMVLGVFWIVLGSGGAIGMGFKSAADCYRPGCAGPGPPRHRTVPARFLGCGLEWLWIAGPAEMGAASNNRPFGATPPLGAACHAAHRSRTRLACASCGGADKRRGGLQSVVRGCEDEPATGQEMLKGMTCVVLLTTAVLAPGSLR